LRGAGAEVVVETYSNRPMSIGSSVAVGGAKLGMSISPGYLDASATIAAVAHEVRVDALLNMTRMTASQTSIQNIPSIPQQQHGLSERALLGTHAARIASGASIFFPARVSERLQLVRCSHTRGGTASTHTCEKRLENRLMPKFLFITRDSTTHESRPSPEEMQAAAGQWHAWMHKFSASIVGGDGLKPSGRLVKAGIVTDGPYVEAKEFIASFTIIQADNYDAAVAIALECPGCMPIEIRQMGGYA
jgi:hypothetical protein